MTETPATPYATGGMIRNTASAWIGTDPCRVPAAVTCGCGRGLHITVNLDPAQIETAVEKIMARMRADALRWASRHAPQFGG